MNELNIMIDELGDIMDKIRAEQGEREAKETHNLQADELKNFDVWILFTRNSGVTEAITMETFKNDPTLILSSIRVTNGPDYNWDKEERKFKPHF